MNNIDPMENISVSPELWRLYKKMFVGFLEEGRPEMAELWHEEVLNNCVSVNHRKKHTIFSWGREWILVSAYRELIKIGRADVAKVLRDEVIENPEYRQLNLFG